MIRDPFPSNPKDPWNLLAQEMMIKSALENPSAQAAGSVAPEETSSGLSTGDDLIRQFFGEAADIRDNPETIPGQERTARYTNKADTVSVRPEMISEDTRKRLEGALRNRQISSFDDQQAGIEEMEGDLERFRNIPPQLDITPVAALVDQWTKSNLTKTYDKPMSPEEKQMAMLKLQSEIQKHRTGLAENDLTYMKSMLGGQEQFKRNENLELGAGSAPPRPATPYALGRYDVDKIEADVQKLEGNLGDATTTIFSHMDELERLIGDLDGTKAIPGVGPGTKLAPDFMLSEKGSRVRQLATDLYRQKVYLASGKSINESEARDQMKIVGLGLDSKESSFRAGVKGLLKEIRGIVAKKQAAFRPEVVERYRNRGGRTLQDFDARFFSPKKKTQDSVPTSQSAPAAPSKKAAPAVGAIVEVGGKKYQFKGGENIKSNYVEVK